MFAVVPISPHLRRFGEKHPIAERHDQGAVRTCDAKQLRCNGFRLLQILPASHDQGGIDTGIVERQMLILVEVLHPMTIEAWIGSQFLLIESMANDALIVDIFRQMAHPAAHQIKNHCARRNPLAIQIREPLAETGIEMMHKAWFAVEQRIVAAIQLVTLGVFKNPDDRHCSAEIEIPAHHASKLTGNSPSADQLADQRSDKPHHRGSAVEPFHRFQGRAVPGTCRGERLTKALRCLVFELGLRHA